MVGLSIDGETTNGDREKDLLGGASGSGRRALGPGAERQAAVYRRRHGNGAWGERSAVRSSQSVHEKGKGRLAHPRAGRDRQATRQYGPQKRCRRIVGWAEVPGAFRRPP